MLPSSCAKLSRSVTSWCCGCPIKLNSMLFLVITFSYLILCFLFQFHFWSFSLMKNWNPSGFGLSLSLVWRWICSDLGGYWVFLLWLELQLIVELIGLSVWLGSAWLDLIRNSVNLGWYCCTELFWWISMSRLKLSWYDCDHSFRVLGSIHSLLLSLMWRWNQISTYVFGRLRLRIALLLSTWTCLISLLEDPSPLILLWWIPTREFLRLKVGLLLDVLEYRAWWALVL